MNALPRCWKTDLLVSECGHCTGVEQEYEDSLSDDVSFEVIRRRDQ